MSNQAASTVIVAFRSELVSDVYCIALEEVFGSHLVVCTDTAAASQALRKHPDACVVIEGAVADGSLTEFLRNQATVARRAHVLVLGGDPASAPEGLDGVRAEFLPDKPRMKEVVDRLDGVLKARATANEYCRITPKSLLVRSDKLRCDVYIKLGEEKYVKVLHANDRFDQADFDRFVAKKVDYLYLPRADFLGLMDDLLLRARELSADPSRITVETALNTNVAIFQVVHAAFETDGFTPQLQRLTLASVDLAAQTLKKNPKLSELLAKLDANRDSYLSWHSTALSFVACKLATLMGWQSDTTFYKLSLAALLHDITLPTDELARILTAAELKSAALPARERAKVLQHPMEAARLVNNLDEVPGEVSFIVEQHHERQDGLGFPKGVDHQEISPISALFIIAHDVVTTMFDAPPANFQMADFLSAREVMKTYSKGAFGQVFRELMAKAKEM